MRKVPYVILVTTIVCLVLVIAFCLLFRKAYGDKQFFEAEHSYKLKNAAMGRLYENLFVQSSMCLQRNLSKYPDNIALAKYRVKIVADREVYFFPNNVGGRIRLKVVDARSGKLVSDCIIFCKELSMEKTCKNGIVEFIIWPDKDRRYTLTFYALRDGEQISDKIVITVVFSDIRLYFRIEKAVKRNGAYWVNYGDTIQIYVDPKLTVTNETLYGVSVLFENKIFQLPAFIDITPEFGEQEYFFTIIDSPYNLACNQTYSLRIVATYILLEPDKPFYTFEDLPTYVNIKALWAHDKKPVVGALVECLETGEIRESGKDGILVFRLVGNRKKYSFTLAECFKKVICKCSPCIVNIVKKYIMLKSKTIIYSVFGEAIKLPVNVSWSDGRPVDGILVYLAEKSSVENILNKGSTVLEWSENKPGVYEYTIMLKTEEIYVPYKVLVICTGFNFEVLQADFSKKADRAIVKARITWVHNGSPVYNAKIIIHTLNQKTSSDDNGYFTVEIGLDSVYKRRIKSINLTICKKLGNNTICFRRILDINFEPLKVKAFVRNNKVFLHIEWLPNSKILLLNGSKIILKTGNITLHEQLEKPNLKLFSIQNALYAGNEEIYLLPIEQIGKPIISDELNIEVKIIADVSSSDKTLIHVLVFSKAKNVIFLNTTVFLETADKVFIKKIEALPPEEFENLTFKLDKPLIGCIDVNVRVENGIIKIEKSEKYMVIYMPMLLLVSFPPLILIIKKRELLENLKEKIDVKSKIQVFRQVLKLLLRLLKHIRERTSRKFEDHIV